MSASAAAPYAVVVATKDRGAKIVPLLDSVLASDISDFELVVVDQSTVDDTERAVAPFLSDPRVRYVRSAERGLSKGRNLGISLTTAPLIMITDDDCIVPPNWIGGLAKPFADDPRVGMVFCTVRPVPVTEAGHTPYIIFASSRTLSDPLEAWVAARDGLPLGAGMAVRRAMYDELGGFDPLLGAGARFGSLEDSDLSWRGLLSGWSTVHSADVTVMHDGFRNLEELRSLVIRDFYGVGGGIAKYLRARQFKVLVFLFGWLIRFGVVSPIQELRAGRRPRGFRRPYMLLRGVMDGLRTPFDRSTLLYASRPE